MSITTANPTLLSQTIVGKISVFSLTLAMAHFFPKELIQLDLGHTRQRWQWVMSVVTTNPQDIVTN
jgi:hypothetical protein